MFFDNAYITKMGEVSLLAPKPTAFSLSPLRWQAPRNAPKKEEKPSSGGMDAAVIIALVGVLRHTNYILIMYSSINGAKLRDKKWHGSHFFIRTALFRLGCFSF
jgi:hypothetical protein